MKRAWQNLLLKQVSLLILLTLSLSSCLSLDNERVYTAGEEKALRHNYLKNLENLDHDIDTTELGVYYVVLNEDGQGDYAKMGDTLTVGYSGWFIDEVLFDSSEIHYPDGKMTFVLGDPPSIPGWDDAMKVMNKGARIQFIIPSELAYGSSWHGTIPPYQTLIFVVELFDIKPS